MQNLYQEEDNIEGKKMIQTLNLSHNQTLNLSHSLIQILIQLQKEKKTG